MRLIRRATVVAALVFVTAPVLSAQGGASAPKFAYIKSQALLQSAPGASEAQAQFEREMASYRTQVQRMGDSLNALVDSYKKAEVTLSPTAKESRMKAINAKEEEYQTRTRELEQKAQQRQVELVRPITEQIQQAISQLRQEEGYAMIFDADAQGGALVAADTTLDVTSRVLARLQTLAKAAPAGGVPAKPAAGPALGQPAGVTRPKTPPTR